MKKIAIAVMIAATLASCTGNRSAVSTTDDVYAVPSEEKKKDEMIAAERNRQQAEEREKLAQEEKLANEEKKRQEEKTANNPYYKDPVYKSDDYYDYEYSSRINRFSRPIGLGYYDSYYTNMYTYNQNPMMYGTSIYSSYGYGMPSQRFNSISFGISSGYGFNSMCSPYSGYNFGYNYYYPYSYGYCYDPWGYNYNSGFGYGFGYGYGNSWGYNPYFQSYNNGFYNGYYNGYSNGYYNSQWNYLNSFDANSGYGQMTSTPRTTNIGGNSRRTTSPGMIMEDNGQRRYFQSVSDQQQNTPRFNTPSGRMRNPSPDNGGLARPTDNGGRRYENNTMRDDGRNRNSTRMMERQNNQNFPENTSRRSSEPVFNQPDNSSRSGGYQEHSPRNSNSGGGGGGHRPR
jgi:hypothetical protein